MRKPREFRLLAVHEYFNMIDSSIEPGGRSWGKETTLMTKDPLPASAN